MSLNPDFNCYSNFVLFWVGNVTTGTTIWVSAIAKVATLYGYQMKQFSHQFEIRLISKLIKGISRVLRKLN